MPNEQAWIELAQGGDQSALAKLLHANYAFLVQYLIKITLQPPLAEDVAQETMIRAIEHIERYNGTSKFSSWLITIATRIYLDILRKEKREHKWHEEEASLRKLQWEANSKGERWFDSVEALSKLQEEMRIPIILKHYYGYSQMEIAKLLELREGTVKSRIHYGLQQLRRELNKHET